MTGQNADGIGSRLPAEKDVEGMIAHHDGLRWKGAQYPERGVQVIRVRLDPVRVITRHKGLAKIGDIREDLEDGCAAVPGDNAGPDRTSGKIGEQLSRSVEQSALPGGLDLHVRDPFHGLGPKASCPTRFELL